MSCAAQEWATNVDCTPTIAACGKFEAGEQ